MSCLDRKLDELVVVVSVDDVVGSNNDDDDDDANDIDDDTADSRAHKLFTILEYIQTNCLPTLVSRHEYTSSSFLFLLDNDDDKKLLP